VLEYVSLGDLPRSTLTDRQTDRQTDDGSDWIDDGSEEWFKTYPGSFNWDSSLWLEELKLLRFKYLYNKQTACYSKKLSTILA
jgi:hypothetical protein